MKFKSDAQRKAVMSKYGGDRPSISSSSIQAIKQRRLEQQKQDPQSFKNVWKQKPLRFNSNNPTSARVQAYQQGDVWIYRRTFPESNRIEVWKENRKTNRVTSRKEFKDTYEDSRNAKNYVQKIMGKNQHIVDE